MWLHSKGAPRQGVPWSSTRVVIGGYVHKLRSIPCRPASDAVDKPLLLRGGGRGGRPARLVPRSVGKSQRTQPAFRQGSWARVDLHQLCYYYDAVPNCETARSKVRSSSTSGAAWAASPFACHCPDDEVRRCSMITCVGPVVALNHRRRGRCFEIQ